jgi:adenosylmethionine-8-amino-7-oxononanoate aminotransferase
MAMISHGQLYSLSNLACQVGLAAHSLTVEDPVAKRVTEKADNILKQ